MVKFSFCLILIVSALQAFCQDFDFYITPSKILEVETNQFTLRKWNNFKKEHKRYFSQVNKNFEYWLELDKMNALWSYTSAGFYINESIKAKREVLRDQLFHYLSYRGRRNPLRGELELWRMGLRRDYEIDQRSMLTNNGNTFSYDGVNIEGNEKRKVQKKGLFKLGFKPYLFRGLVVTSLRSKWFESHLFTGVNREVEFRLVKRFTKIKLRVGSDYDFFNSRLLAYIDKRFNKNFRARLSAQKFMKSDGNLSDSIYTTVNFFKRF